MLDETIMNMLDTVSREYGPHKWSNKQPEKRNVAGYEVVSTTWTPLSQTAEGAKKKYAYA